MPAKEYELPDIGVVKLYKRKGTKNLRLSVSGGTIRVTMPYWAPYRAALDFVKSRQDWIVQNKPAATPLLAHHDRIGKAHHLVFRPTSGLDKPRTRILQTEIVIAYPSNLTPGDASVQAAAVAAAIRALKLQAEKLLPQRISSLAKQHGLTYRSVRVKQLRARWGSCDSDQHIALNLFLMQLPWDLIDYVLLHELVHTKVLNHGADFWALFESCLPEARVRRKVIKGYAPVLEPIRMSTVA